MPTKLEKKRKRQQQTYREKRVSMDHDVQILEMSEMELDVTLSKTNENYLGKMNVVCNFCSAQYFPVEREKRKKIFTKCCQEGRLTTIPPHKGLNPTIESLLHGTHELSGHFLRNTRKYNNAVSLASTCFNERVFKSFGPPCLIVNGEIRHYLSSLNTDIGKSPSFGQVYCIDPEEANAILCRKPEIRMDLITQLFNEMKVINPYVQAYKMMKEVQDYFEEREAELRDIRMWFVKNPADSARSFGNVIVGRNSARPVFNEVAIVYAGDENPESLSTELCVYSRKNNLHWISHMKAEMDPLCYTLMFPYGDRGYEPTLVDHKGKKVSERRYYLYNLCQKDGYSQPQLHFRKLTNQYICDAWVRVERSRLVYIKQHQAQLRAEIYSGIRDQLAKCALENSATLGKCVILPSTFEGSSRHMYEAYQDAMCLVRRFGKPDYFITMTCNPNWKEIKENLRGTETSSDRPDLVSRVFKHKLDALLEILNEGKIFGEPLARNSVIEFQQRGLPHSHILLYVKPEKKRRTGEAIDEVISAEIPDKSTNPDLYEIIVAQNIHRCTLDRCLKEDGTCSKKFPRPFTDSTQVDTKSFPLYKRDKTVSQTLSNGTVITNAYVVPYNPILSKMFNTHINVESCVSIGSVKYINMYMNKGVDIVTVGMKETTNDGTNQNRIEYDEIDHFVRARYVGPCEAYWRLMGYPMSEISHSIVRLAVHLPGKNVVRFDPEEMSTSVQKVRPTTLMGWFTLNTVDVNARKYLYTEIPDHYIWSPSGEWKPRKATPKPVISRIYHVFPNDMERYCLRLLLLHIRGARSFDDLKRDPNNAGGRICATFQEAARLNGLLDSDEQWEACLNEAASTCHPRKLRELFALICCLCKPSNPRELWDKFTDQLIEDFVATGSDRERSVHKALSHLNEEIASYQNSFTLHTLGLPEFQDEDERTDNEPSTFAPPSDAEETVQTMQASLNNEQLDCFQRIQRAILYPERPETKLFYVDGPGGTGKTYLYNTIISWIRQHGGETISCAFTGIAANLLQNGATIHRAFGVPLEEEALTTLTISPNSKEGQNIRKATAIIFDEASMIPAWILSYIDRLLKDITQRPECFGGKVIVFGGDFRQCLPIARTPNKGDILSICIRASPIWREIHQISLTKNMRVREGQEDFAAWLLQVGNGTLGDQITMPEGMMSKTEGELISRVFGNTMGPGCHARLANRGILTVSNKTALVLNNLVLEYFEGQARTYLSTDSIVQRDGDDPYSEVTDEYIHSQTPSGFPPHVLNLKIGCPIILVRNLNVKKGLCNGTRLIVTDLKDTHIHARPALGGETFIIPRIPIIAEDPCTRKNIQRVQLPIRLAFAMTINKSQGQTFEKVGLHLREEVFTHGQLYVAMSRVRSPDDLSIFTGRNPLSPEGPPQTLRNVVFREVLL